MRKTDNDDFHIGYLPELAAGLKRPIRRVAAALLALAAVAALAVVFAFERLPESHFEFGGVREFEGTIIENPYPGLIVMKPAGDVGRSTTLIQYLLVGEGKHAADVTGLAGRRVRLRGTMIHRAEGSMIEVARGAIVPGGPATTTIQQPEDLGRFTLRGEIVDSKCYLGVMNPGRTKVHRDCAVRCISGGIPPLFIAVDSEGNEVALILASPEGRPVNQAVLDMVAEPVEITGHIIQEAGGLTLRADPANYKRLAGAAGTRE